MDPKVFQRVRYCGSVGILESLTNFDNSTREEIVAFAVYTLALASNRDFSPSGGNLREEEIQRIVGKKSVPERSQQLYEVTVDPNFIKLSKKERQSVNGGNLQTVTTEMAIFNMSLISFASLDQDIFVSFVAKKEDGTHRACYVLECCDHYVANQMYHVMEQFFVEPSPPPAPFIVQSMTLSGRKWDDTIPSGSTAQMHIPRRSLESENGSPSRGSAYRNATEEPPKPPDRKSLRTKNIPAIEPVQNYVNSDAILQAQQGKFPQRCTPSANLANPSSRSSHILEVVNAARCLPYFFKFQPGLSAREQAERELRINGDDGAFLLREASTELIDEVNRVRNITLSVLNYNANGLPIFQHVLMLDSCQQLDNGSGRGLVRTQEREFQSIEELIDHYLPADRVLHLPSQSGHLNISVPIICNAQTSLRRNPPQENVYVRITLTDGRVCVLEDNENIAADKAVVFMPGACGCLDTDFKIQWEKESPFHKYREMSNHPFEPAGHGRARPPLRTWPAANLLQRDAEDFAFCLKELGIDRANLIGWSDGGITAICVAGNKSLSSVVEKMIVFGSNATLPESDRETYLKMRNTDNWGARAREPYETVYGAAEFKDMWANWIDCFLTYIDERNGDVCRTELQNVDSPSLVIHGEKDFWITQEMADEIVNGLKSNNVPVQYKAFPGGKHNLHMKYASDFAQICTNFIDE
ncbi:Oidioi.mRNA.OKI2018_I69.XSR.g15052.t1.cds [Oikopleura dioica]|uniref:Oidioi.mRNA.OKI2018_I69.XSR.g15052.t1.cds n=1 Tax=Oikopleura dioica TaxID=34765 RepID=A0ABN7SHZ0_OIKDI|nr:Oidioi.mRNA.OKI2018_I69.XSR.g15052.t1.cds [Oikopleura dioica]